MHVVAVQNLNVPSIQKCIADVDEPVNWMHAEPTALYRVPSAQDEDMDRIVTWVSVQAATAGSATFAVVEKHCGVG